MLEQQTDDEVTVPLIKSNDSSRNKTETYRRCGKYRYIIAFLMSIGFALDYLLRINMSFALEGGLVQKNCTGYYCWSEDLQGKVLSSFLWGYWVTQLPGALLCYYFGANILFGTGLTIATLATLLCPIAAKTNPWLLIVLRIFIGIGQGVTFPVAVFIITKWSPFSDKTFFMSLSTGGQYLGAILANELSGYLCDTSLMGGWPSVFYVYSIIGCCWSVAWFVFVTDSPTSSRWISEAEKQYLSHSTYPGVPINIKEVPWKKIFTNIPTMSAITAHLLNGYGYYMLLNDLPKFLDDVLRYDIKSSGFIAGIPYLSIYFGYLFSGLASDLLIKKEIFTRTTTRRVSAFCAFFVPGVFLTILSFLHSKIAILFLMNIAMFFNGFANCCYFVNYMDHSPKLSGITSGIGNGLCAIIGLIGPLIVGALLNDVDKTNHELLHQKWKIAFTTASAVWALGAIQFCILGSGELQHDLQDDDNLPDRSHEHVN